MNKPVARLQEESTTDNALERLLEQVVKNAQRNKSLRGGQTTHMRPIDIDKSEVLLDVVVRGTRFVLVQSAVEPTKIASVVVRDCSTLSPREQEIARMVMKGYPNKTIAAVLDISIWTVGTHLRRIFSKLGVGNRASMVAQLLDGNHPDHD
jgi:DNA-binding CsgD family transcriptional regulator